MSIFEICINFDFVELNLMSFPVIRFDFIYTFGAFGSSHFIQLKRERRQHPQEAGKAPPKRRGGKNIKKVWESSATHKRRSKIRTTHKPRGEKQHDPKDSGGQAPQLKRRRTREKQHHPQKGGRKSTTTQVEATTAPLQGREEHSTAQKEGGTTTLLYPN